MKFSFIIPSADRDKELQNCISSIEKAYENEKNIDIEIIIVFNGKNNKNSFLELKYQDLTSTYYINQKNVCRARNLGIRKSDGEYIILIDDDARIKEDFLIILKKSVMNLGAQTFCGKIIDPVTRECFSKNDCRITKKYLNRLDYNLFRGSALAVNKNIVEKVGLYDENFGPGGKYHSAEESDLFFKIKMINERVIFLPDLVVFHPILNKTPAMKILNRSYATGAMLTKYCLLDRAHFLIYFFLILRIMFICAVRLLQKLFFPKSIQKKSERHQYYFVLKGIINGIIDYIKFR